MSIDRESDKQNLVFTYTEIIFCLKNKGSSGTCYNMDET